MKINEGGSNRWNQVNRDAGSTAPARETGRTRNETPAAPPRDPAAERIQALRNQDGFDVRPVRSGPDLTGGTAPATQSAQPGTTQETTLSEGRASVTTTTTDANGNKSTDSVSTGGGNVALGSETENADGSGHGSSVEVGSDGATFSTSRTNSNGVTSSGSVGVTPNGVNASQGVEVEGPRGLSFKFETSVSFSRETESENGFTTVKAEGDMNVSFGGGVDAGVGGFSAERTEGVKSTYELRLSDADYARVQSGEIPHPDPFNPDTLPTGSSVLLNSSDYTGTGFEASYRNLKLQTNVTQEQGVSTLVEKTGPNTVRVTAGPTEAVENSFQLGLELGPASAHIGNTTRLDSFKLQTAEFDISTPEGRAAYNEFLVNGQLPQQNGTGISNVATVEKLQVDSTTSAGAALGPWANEVELNSNKLDQVVTTYPDGSQNRVTNLDYGTAVPVTIDQHFRPDGTEDLSQQRISLDMKDTDPASASYLYEAFTGDSEGALALHEQGERNVQLSLTHAQAQQLQERVREQLASFGPDWHPISVQDRLLQDIANAPSPEAAALAIGRGWSGSGSLAEQLLSAAYDTSTGDTVQPLPGTITVEPQRE